eukprot:scaffold8605_cov178-Amphora_coffeaeformis.AAC.18
MAAQFRDEVRGGRNTPTTPNPFPSLLELYERALFYEMLDAPVRVVANDVAEARPNLLNRPYLEDRSDHILKVIEEVVRISDEIQADNDRGAK